MEPRYLIGGPDSPQRVNPQKAEQTRREITETVTDGTYGGKTAAQWRSMAETRRAATRLTSAREYELCAILAEDGGTAEFPALFTAMGAYVAQAVYVRTRHGRWVWRIGTGEAVGWFASSQARSGATRRRSDAQKGFLVGRIRTAARVVCELGKLGVQHCYIAQVDRAHVEIIDNGTGGSCYRDWS